MLPCSSPIQFTVLCVVIARLSFPTESPRAVRMGGDEIAALVGEPV